MVHSKIHPSGKMSAGQDQRLTGEEDGGVGIIGNLCDKIMLPSAQAKTTRRFTRGPQMRVQRLNSPWLFSFFVIKIVTPAQY